MKEVDFLVWILALVMDVKLSERVVRRCSNPSSLVEEGHNLVPGIR